MGKAMEERADQLQKQFSRVMTEEERAFLHDLQAFIDFSLRSGLTFMTVVATVGRDVNAVLRDGFDLQWAKSQGFSPKTAGYGDITEDSFGEVEE